MEEVTKYNTNISWTRIFFSLIVGCIFFSLLFPNIAILLIENYVTNQAVQVVLIKTIHQLEYGFDVSTGFLPFKSYTELMGYIFLLIWIFLTLILLSGLRRLDYRIPIYGIIGLLFGYFFLHFLTWPIIIFLKIIGFFFVISGYISAFFSEIFSFFAAENRWWYLIIVGILILIYFFRKNSLWILMGLSGLGLLIWLGSIIFPIVGNWIKNLFEPIRAFFSNIWDNYLSSFFSIVITIIGKIFYAIFIVFVGFIITNIMGRLVIDQIRGSFIAGWGVKGILASGFSIGSTLAIVTVTSIAILPISQQIDSGWNESFVMIEEYSNTNISIKPINEPSALFLNTLPESFKQFAYKYFTKTRPPIIESLLLLLILLISNASLIFYLIMPLPRDMSNLSIGFFPRELGSLFRGVVIMIFSIFVPDSSEN